MSGSATKPEAEAELATILSTAVAGDVSDGPRERGFDCFDRYVVLDRIGKGGMGVVYAAYDPRLDRKLALKVILAGGHEDQRQVRLLREAQSLAKLSHPNVVSVFDSGVVEGELYVAMELVEGATLREWCARERQPWTVAVGKLLDVGRGLATVHAAGLVHRDVKPDNVLIEASGRAVLIDFGLARVLDGQDRLEVSGERSPATIDLSKIDTHDRLTQVGAVLGSPAYMAPEQLEGLDGGAAADQFSLCVSIWESVYGKRPFEGRNVAQLLFALNNEEPSAPASSEVPRWLERVLVRGMKRDPAERWPSVAALVSAIEAGLEAPRRRTRRIRSGVALGLSAALALAAGWWLAGGLNDAGSLGPACDSGLVELERALGDERRRAIRAAFAADDAAPWLIAQGEATLARLQEYADSWAELRDEGCRRHSRGSLSAAAFDRRNACLDRRLVELEAVTSTLEDSGPEALVDASDVLGVLGPLGSCTDDLRLAERERGAQAFADPAQAQAVAEAGRTLARAKSLHLAGRDGEAMAALDALPAAARAHGPTRAAADFERAMTLQSLGKSDAALVAMSDALWAAEAAGDVELTAACATQRLKMLAGSTQLGDDLATPWLPHARAVVKRANDPARDAMLLAAEGLVASRNGRYEQSRDLQLAAIKQTEALGDSIEVARSLATLHGNLSPALRETGDYAGALEHARLALSAGQRLYGDRHPKMGTLAYQTAAAALEANDHATAAGYLDQCLAIWTETLGPEHPNTITAITARARTHRGLGELEQARRVGLRGLEIASRVTPGSMAEDLLLQGLGNTALELGDLASAREYFDQSLSIRRAGVEAGDRRLVLPLRHLADAELALARYDAAKALYLEAKVIIDENGGSRLDLPDVLSGLAAIALAEGDPSRARELLVEALAIRAEVEEVYPRDLALAKLRLAEASWALAKDEDARELARGFARDSQRALETAGPLAERERERTRQWLREHDR